MTLARILFTAALVLPESFAVSPPAPGVRKSEDTPEANPKGTQKASPKLVSVSAETTKDGSVASEAYSKDGEIKKRKHVETRVTNMKMDAKAGAKTEVEKLSTRVEQGVEKEAVQKVQVDRHKETKHFPAIMYAAGTKSGLDASVGFSSDSAKGDSKTLQESAVEAQWHAERAQQAFQSTQGHTTNIHHTAGEFHDTLGQLRAGVTDYALWCLSFLALFL